MAQKRNIIEGAMRNYTLVFFFMAVIVIFGSSRCPSSRKTNFPK